MGWPIRRRRTSAWCVNSERLAWVGPAFQKDLNEDFLKHFGSTCILTADVFAKEDSERNIAAELQDLAHKRRLFINPKHFSTSDFKNLLCLSGRSRFIKYEQSFSVDPSGTFVCDLSQDPSFRKRSGSIFGALMRGSQYYSFSKQHLFTQNELMAAHGWPSLRQPCGGQAASLEPPVWMTAAAHQMTLQQSKCLIGSGMHLHCLAAWMLYCLRHTVRKDLINGNSDQLVALNMSQPGMDEEDEISRGSPTQPPCAGKRAEG
jgi:hypothetical protein